MAGRALDDETQWAAEKRDFVADRRDELAARRDATADARELTADQRERALDERERLLDLRAAELSLMPAVSQRVERAEAGVRVEARQTREQAHRARDLAAGAREEAAERRLEATPTTRLAATFAAIAQNLYSADSYDAVLHRIAEAAVETVAGCEMASVSLVERDVHRTAARTADGAAAVDRAQYEAGEGPCLDAVDAPLVYARSFPDPRWPTLGSRPVELGACSAASYRLAGAGSADAPDPARTATTGSLNTYSRAPDAFSAEAQQIGLILAAHASMAAAVVRERGHLRDRTQQLSEALVSRDVIGQAKGILMERLKLTPEQAFDALRHSSNQLNEKLQSVARALAETGEFDAGGTSRT